MNKIIKLLTATLILITTFSCNNLNKEKNNETSTISGNLTIFHAGSLSVPFKQISKEFEKKYPDVKVLRESAGSVTCARKITDLKRECDIMASADYTIINKLLIPDYAKWNIKFASNEMVIAFTEKSKYHNKINKTNWFNILLKEDIFYGRSDPNSDPCGYRSVLTTKLAADYYNNPELPEKLLSKDNNFIRPKEVDLLSLLENNTIDYIFIYRSVAEQHKLNFILLPDSINLKKPELSDYYSRVSVKIKGKKPGEFITQKGEPMVYGITLLDKAPNKPTANAFMDFLLSKEQGMKIMEENGQPSVIPSVTKTFNNIPEKWKKYAREKSK
ncbi:MAG: tungstate ABC transporter substrate-binding protein WtpA [Bacteroidales bacterium]|nr:tungstate ABC transporter substrate-binding protein WtpA [Bacteroidales bacterium]